MQREESRNRNRGTAPSALHKYRQNSTDPEPRQGLHLETLGRYVRAHSGTGVAAADHLNLRMPSKKFCVSEHVFNSWQINSGKWIPRRAALTDRVLALSKDPASPFAVHLVPLHEITTVTSGSSTFGRADSAGLNRASLDGSDASVLQVVTKKVAFCLRVCGCQFACVRVSACEDSPANARVQGGFNFGRTFMLRTESRQVRDEWIARISEEVPHARQRWKRHNFFRDMQVRQKESYSCPPAHSVTVSVFTSCV